MATTSDINTKITNLLGGIDTNTFQNSDRLIDLNMWNEKITGMIIDSMDETDFDDARQSNYPIFTFPLTTSRDYLFPITLGILKIKSFSVTYDGVNYYDANPVDDTENQYGIAPASATVANQTIDANFAIPNPQYDIKYGSLWLYPIATAAQVAAGAQGIIEVFRAPVPFSLNDLNSGSTTIPGFDSTFHMMLAYGVAAEYCKGKTLPQENSIMQGLSDWETRLRTQYSSKQLDRRSELVPEYQNYK